MKKNLCDKVTLRDITEYSIYKREQIRVNDWKFRCMVEAMSYDQNCVLTLTYNDDCLPPYGILSMSDYQNFLKRYRKAIYPRKIRFFGCGEYGSKGGRPHYHIIIFGHCPDDCVYFYKDKKKTELYRSSFISDLWARGYITVCPKVEMNVIPYVCKYLQKFNEVSPQLYEYYNNPDKYPDEYLYIKMHWQPPFITMSRRPGIGEQALNSSMIDWNTDKLYVNGKYIRIPRYYLNRMKQAELSEPVVYRDSDDMLEFVDNCPIVTRDTSVDYLLEKRRKYWQNRFDDEKYCNSVLKFKKFKSEH